jgi:hypothetical protein
VKGIPALIKKHSAWVAGIAAFIILFLLFFTYTRGGMSGRVVDADTGKPIPGVIVVVNWRIVASSPAGDATIGQLHITETITDSKGRYRFSAWGPKVLFFGHLDSGAPRAIYFKDGYKYVIKDNSERLFQHAPEFPDPHGDVIKLVKFSGSKLEYAKHVKLLDNETTYSFRYGKKCEWKKVPRLLVALERISLQMESDGIRLPGWEIGNNIQTTKQVGNVKECGSPDQFF